MIHGYLPYSKAQLHERRWTANLTVSFLRKAGVSGRPLRTTANSWISLYRNPYIKRPWALCFTFRYRLIICTCTRLTRHEHGLSHTAAVNAECDAPIDPLYIVLRAAWSYDSIRIRGSVRDTDNPNPFHIKEV